MVKEFNTVTASPSAERGTNYTPPLPTSTDRSTSYKTHIFILAFFIVGAVLTVANPLAGLVLLGIGAASLLIYKIFSTKTETPTPRLPYLETPRVIPNPPPPPVVRGNPSAHKGTLPIVDIEEALEPEEEFNEGAYQGITHYVSMEDQDN